MAAIGGGSLAAGGGLGMAGGAAILSGTVAAPVLAVAGFAYNSYAQKSLEKAKESLNEAKLSTEKSNLIKIKLQTANEYILKVIRTLADLDKTFNKHYDKLVAINGLKTLKMHDELAKLNDEILQEVALGYNLAAIMTKLMTTPIFKLKQNGDELEPEIDENGMYVLNEDELEQSLEDTAKQSQAYKA